MPNHVQNRLKVLGPKKQVQEALDSIKSIDESGKERSIDFNKILPMPETLHVESGSYGWTTSFLLFGISDHLGFQSHKEEAARFASWTREEQKKAIEMAFAYKDNKDKYGHTTWYDWACDVWGTKWNAYQNPDKRDTFDTIHFQTAWSCPIPVLEALSKKFPKLTFEIMWADEDTGSNTGWRRYKAGKAILKNDPKNGSDEAYELAFELRPGLKKEFKKVKGKYQYAEE